MLGHRPILCAHFAIGSLILATLLLNGCNKADQPQQTPARVRIGYFANLTHAQAVLGVSSGEFAQALQPAALETKVFNAGPSLIESLLAGEIDVGYVGPGPALNAHEKSRGHGIRVVAGAAANGVLIVARKGSGIHSLADLASKRVATPQHGNTQDIAARYYISHVLHQDGAPGVVPIANAEQLGMMTRGQIDAAWAPEPWGSRLVAEADAQVIAEEKDLWPDRKFILTLVVTTPEFLDRHPQTIQKILAVHHQWTLRLQNEPDKYVPRLEAALFAVNGKKLPKGVMASSLARVQFTDDPLENTIRTMGTWAYELGFSPRPANLANLIDTRVLHDVQ